MVTVFHITPLVLRRPVSPQILACRGVFVASFLHTFVFLRHLLAYLLLLTFKCAYYKTQAPSSTKTTHAIPVFPMDYTPSQIHL